MIGRTALVGAGLLTAALLAPSTVPASAAPAATAVPRPDHVVIVLEENHGVGSVLGSPSAPFINQLAAENANFTQSFAETHPSQPNYLALFSGATQGITDDSCPHTFSTPNLGQQLIDAGVGFTGYSETLPSAGFTGCGSGKYARKHNPWVNWPSVPASANQPFTAFPSDYSTLPAVSFVIPNLDNDMHDGTVAQGDSWLQSRLGGYIDWAKTHNSLFILSFDEDEGGATNQIPTIFAGERVVLGSYSERINHYNVLRTVQDAYGLAPTANSANAAPILDIWTTPANGAPPVASFTSSCSVNVCSFDATSSTDPDGTITGYAWAFGDGATGSGPSPSRTYATGGTFAVTLTVTDDAGNRSAVTHPVTTTAPPGQVIAADAFNRTRTSGFGNADVGGAWSIGNPANYSVVPGHGSLRLATAGSLLTAYLPATVSSDIDLTADIGADRLGTGNGLYTTVSARRVTSRDEYRARVRINGAGVVLLQLTRLVGGSETTIAAEVKLAGVTYTAGQSLAVRVQATGTNPTTVRARAWLDGATEPTAWTLTATDTSAALQKAGSIGYSFYLSSGSTNAPVVVSLSALTARIPGGAPPPNQPPTASFSAQCTGLTCTFDASASADTDGSVVGYAWDFGDASNGSGATPSHTYTQGGTYSVTLTVTDDDGASSAISHPVTPVAPPVNQPPDASFTSQCVALTCNFDASASTDPEGAVAAYSWTFGDSTTATGVNPSHTYAAAGTRTVTLTVTDGGGLTDTVGHPVTVTAPAGAPFASDGFTRTVSNGWGQADVGGTWRITGNATAFSVGGGTGNLRLAAPGNQISANLPNLTETDTDLVLTITCDKVPTSSGLYLTVAGRVVSPGNEYRARARINGAGAVTLRLTRAVGGAETALTSEIVLPGITYTAGSALTVRVQVTGTRPTVLRARIWNTPGAEPSTWPVAATDSTASLQSGGSLGLTTYLSTSTTNAPLLVRVSGLSARATGTP